NEAEEFLDKIHIVFDEDGEIYAEAMVDSTHIEWVQRYVDYVQGLGGHLLVERRVDFSQWVSEGFGTADAIVIKDRTMYVIDLKSGRGVQVFAEENTQLMLYGLGAYNDYDMLFDFDSIKLVIVQPPFNHVDEWEITVDDLLDWGENIVKPASELALSEDAERVAGKAQCKWCKAKADCSVSGKKALQVISKDFDDITTPIKILDPMLIDEATVANILEQVELVEGFIKSLKQRAVDTLQRGDSIPRHKLVRGKSNRAWLDKDDAEKRLKRKLKVSELYKKTMLTPAQAEKLMGKGHPLLGELITKPEGKPTLVSITDKRTAIDYTPDCLENDFDGIESDAA
ncbi:MAG: DUF2800 domain-containing protein, partial [Colwellia sp.]|nr:DUF2800 domain-containing protein [Colwellia sp.]